MHKRDLAILALSCFAVYFSLQVRARSLHCACCLVRSHAARPPAACGACQREGAFSFEPAWSFPLDDDVLAAGESALPPPVVADLNGDGRREARARSGLVRCAQLVLR
jgi:hypothetical protein